MIVADASAVLEVLLNTAKAPSIRERFFAERQTIHVPHLIDIEVLQVLRRYAWTNVMSEHRASAALQDYSAISLQRYPHHVLTERIWGLRKNFAAYDAAYIALAEGLNAPLITCDRALASRKHRARVLVY